VVPFLVKTMFSAGRLGCSLFVTMVGVFVLMNNKWFHVRNVNIVATLFLIIWADYLMVVLFTTFDRYLARWIMGF
jgi:hypothetical protein